MGNCICKDSTPNVSAPPLSEPNTQESKQSLSSIDWYDGLTYENTPEYTLEGLCRKVKILRVIDGDTVDIALYHEETSKVYRYRVRLYGIDTPEKRPSKSDPDRNLEIEASLRAKQALEQCFIDNDYIVLAVFYRPDKYGRLLSTFYDKQGDNINEWMVKKGYATEYFGKTKKKFQANSLQTEITV